MEIDRTAFFNAPSLVTKNLTSVGGELEFDPGITYRDSIVYYWRVAIVPQAGSQYIWNTSSFVYIDSVASGVGSHQSHLFHHTQSTPHHIYLALTCAPWIVLSAYKHHCLQIGTFG